jgi:hypothetical protein
LVRTLDLFELVPPVLVQGPRCDCILLDFSQLGSDLPSNLRSQTGLRPLFLRQSSVRSLKDRDPRPAILGQWTSGDPDMELTAPTGSLAGRWHKVPRRGLGLAPNTLPVWAVEPWFWIGYHCAQISSVLGVLLYYNLGRVTRRGWLGPCTAVRAKPSNAN